MRCRECQAENREGAKYCTRCGAPLVINEQSFAGSQPIEPICPNCGAQARIGQKFCIRCGTPLPISTRESSKADVPLSSVPIECPECRTANPEGSTFCNKCGSKLVLETKKRTRYTAPSCANNAFRLIPISGKAARWLVPVFVIAVIAVVVFLVFTWDGQENKSHQIDIKTTMLTSSEIFPAAGGLLLVESNDNNLHGASLDIPAQAFPSSTLLSINIAEELPLDSPFGQIPIGKAFYLEPSGLEFDEPVILTLPIPLGEETQNLYIGVWNNETKRWDNLGGTIDGDFISTEINHLSLYGVFYEGKSTVRIVNEQELDDTDLPITLMYVAGPVPPIEMEDGSLISASRPLPPGGVQLKRDEIRIMELLPGRYHFVVGYPRPQPGVANSMWFTIPELLTGADDGQIDQTITIRDDGAVSSDPFTMLSMDFPGRTVVPTTNFRPMIDVAVTVPAGVNQLVVPVDQSRIPPLVSQLESGTAQRMLIGPIKVEQLQSEGITLSATVTDPEGSPLKYFWSVEGDPLSGIRTVNVGTAASDSRLTYLFMRSRAGIYRVSLTVYDNNKLFNEGQWTIEVIPNAKPYIDIVVDDRVVDFGRLDDKRRNNPMIPPRLGGTVFTIPLGLPNNHPTPFPSDDLRLPPSTWLPIPNWGVYTTPPVLPQTFASTDLKRIVPQGIVPDDPLQYPDGMTCVYAIVADADADLIDASLVLPTPIFGRGNFYTAIQLSDYPIGTLIDNYDVMRNYNATLTEYANRGWLPCQPHFRTPTGALDLSGQPLGPLVAPIEPSFVNYQWGPDPENTVTFILINPPRGEFPYVIAFNGGTDPRGIGIQEGDIVTEAPNPLGLIPQGTVHKVTVVDGSWYDGDAKGYLWMIPVTDDFWDFRNLPNPFAAIPALYVDGTQTTQIATCSYVGQTLPVIWEAPDDPNAEGTVRDHRIMDPDTIPRGGMMYIEGRVRDPFGPDQRAFGLVAWPTPLEHEKEADLEIYKKDSPDPVQAGNRLTYTLTVTNYGPSNATSVVVTDTLPSGVTFVSATSGQGTAREQNGIVTWNIGNLANGTTATLTIVITVPSSAEEGSILINTASVNATENDPYTDNNTTTQTTSVVKEEEEEEEVEYEPPDWDWHWYVYYEGVPGWACMLHLSVEDDYYFEMYEGHTILGAFRTEKEALDYVRGSISDFFCTGGPSALSPSGPKGFIGGDKFALNEIFIPDEEGDFPCPNEWFGCYSMREPQPDKDGDGVPDWIDDGPDTPPGTVVNRSGIPVNKIKP